MVGKKNDGGGIRAKAPGGRAGVGKNNRGGNHISCGLVNFSLNWIIDYKAEV